MTALRQRFIEDLQLHGFAPSTQQVYVTAVKRKRHTWHLLTRAMIEKLELNALTFTLRVEVASDFSAKRPV